MHVLDDSCTDRALDLIGTQDVTIETVEDTRLLEAWSAGRSSSSSSMPLSHMTIPQWPSLQKDSLIVEGKSGSFPSPAKKSKRKVSEWVPNTSVLYSYKALLLSSIDVIMGHINRG